MSLIITPADPTYGDGLSPYPDQPQGPLPLIHYMVGFLGQIQLSVHYLHENGYADYRRWTPPQPIPKDSLIIPATPKRLFTCIEVTKRLQP